MGGGNDSRAKQAVLELIVVVVGTLCAKVASWPAAAGGVFIVCLSTMSLRPLAEGNQATIHQLDRKRKQTNSLSVSRHFGRSFVIVDSIFFPPLIIIIVINVIDSILFVLIYICNDFSKILMTFKIRVRVVASPVSISGHR